MANIYFFNIMFEQGMLLMFQKKQVFISLGRGFLHFSRSFFDRKLFYGLFYYNFFFACETCIYMTLTHFEFNILYILNMC